MTSSAMQIRDYLASLEPSRASMIRKLRTLVRKHLPTGYCEAFDWGMIAYQVPLGRHADTYNGRPLLYVGLGAHKDHAAYEVEDFLRLYVKVRSPRKTGRSGIRSAP